MATKEVKTESAFPVRTEITVLSADDCNQAKIGLPMYEVNGVEVHKYVEGSEPSRDEVGRWQGLESIGDREGIKPGDQILVPDLFGDLLIMRVEADQHGVLSARSQKEDGTPGGLVAILAFGEDDRDCWACTGLINLKGIEKLELSSR